MQLCKEHKCLVGQALHPVLFLKALALQLLLQGMPLGHTDRRSVSLAASFLRVTSHHLCKAGLV